MATERRSWWAVAASCWVLASCATPAIRRFPAAEPLWDDPDRQPVAVRPAEYFSPFGWDAADQTFFLPVSRSLALDVPQQAVNVNALDEVPDSSWFTNRMGRRSMSPGEVARGPCREPPLDPAGPWTVIAAKPNGANPGFIIQDADHRRYLLKFDGVVQGPRATAADVLVSKLYYAAGYFVPCNEIVFFDRAILRIDADAEGENDAGEREALSQSHLDRIFGKALRLRDGRFRASASRFIEGKPIGPWTYQGRRRDDPNDVVRHEDRRDLRGARVLAAWTNHFDAREQNTMAAWIETGSGQGYVRHYYMDFGDCLGSIWEPPMLGRRIGHSSYFDPGHVAADFVTLGAIERPWDRARFGPSGPVFGYFDVESFDPDRYHTGYPNPAFASMREADAAWMARILSQIGDAQLRAAIGTARMGDAFLEAEAFRLLSGRREILLRRYLGRLSPLGGPRVRTDAGFVELCVRDFAVDGGIAAPADRVYGAWVSGDERPHELGRFRRRGRTAEICVELPRSPAPAYRIVDLFVGNDPARLQPPARVHLRRAGDGSYRVVGLERPSRWR